VRDQVNRMASGNYFKLTGPADEASPPPSADAPMIERWPSAGIVLIQEFDISKADPIVAKPCKELPKAAASKIMGYFQERRTLERRLTSDEDRPAAFP